MPSTPAGEDTAAGHRPPTARPLPTGAPKNPGDAAGSTQICNPEMGLRDCQHPWGNSRCPRASCALCRCHPAPRDRSSGVNPPQLPILTCRLGAECYPLAAGLRLVPAGRDGASSETPNPGLGWTEKPVLGDGGCMAGEESTKHRRSVAGDLQSHQSSLTEGPGTTWSHVCRAPSSGRDGAMRLLVLQP